MRVWAYRLLWLFTFTLPWENTFALGERSPARILGFATLCMGVLAVFADHRVRKLARFHVLLLLLLMWMVCTGIQSVSPNLTYQFILVSVQLAGIPLLIWELAPDERQHIGLLWAFVLGCSVSLADLLVGLAHGATRYASENRYAADGMDPNYQAVILVLGISIGVYLYANARSTVARVCCTVFVPTALMGVCLTASRGGLVTLAVCILLICGTHGHHLSAGRALPALLGAALLLFPMLGIVPESSWERLRTTGDEALHGTLTGRTVIWRAGMRAFGDHVLLGVGPGAYRDAVRPYVGGFFAHNSYVESLVEFGVVGAAILVACGIALVASLRRLPVGKGGFWFTLLATMAVGAVSLSWGGDKIPWLLAGLACAQSGDAGGPKVLAECRMPRRRVRSVAERPDCADGRGS